MPEPAAPAVRRGERIAAWLLRGFGTVDLLAVIIVFLPAEWIADGHATTGLGPLPEAVIVNYLTRSTSLLYALHGAMLWGLSTNVPRYRPMIAWLGWLAVIHGAVIFGVDLVLGLPWWWRWAEGPTFAVAGIALLGCTTSREQRDAAD